MIRIAATTLASGCEVKLSHDFAYLRLQSHPPVTGVLKLEIHESALGSAPEGAPGNRGAPGGAPGPESAQGNWGCSRECSRDFAYLRVHCQSTQPVAFPSWSFSSILTHGPQDATGAMSVPTNCLRTVLREAFLTECTKIAHRRSLAIFAADSGIARKSAVGIKVVPFNRRSLAIFFAEEIAHLGASKNRAILRGSGKNRRRNRRESRDFGALRFLTI